MKIAIIGSGISGLSSALLLSQKHNITLFEINKRFGGHANTVDIMYKQSIDSKIKEIPPKTLKTPVELSYY